MKLAIKNHESLKVIDKIAYPPASETTTCHETLPVMSQKTINNLHLVSVIDILDCAGKNSK